jgi:N utilization substance protein B
MSVKGVGDRRRARESALQLLFQEDFNQGGSPSLDQNKKENISDFRDCIVKGVLLNRAEIDRLIEQQVENWSTSRIATVDHNVLRMAIFEIVFLKETPPKVVINEAIEIAKRYGNEHSGAFVNGVLDAIHHALPV